MLSPLVILYGQHQIEELKIPSSDTMTLDAASLLPLVYLVIAVGLASTKHRFVDLTARRICGAARRLHPSGADHAIDTLHICLLMAAIVICRLNAPFSASLSDWVWLAFWSVGRRTNHMVRNHERWRCKFRSKCYATAQAARKVRF